MKTQISSIPKVCWEEPQKLSIGKITEIFSNKKKYVKIINY